MAWTSPPTFSSGEVLSATKLNTLGEDLAYLYGLAQGVNPAIASMHIFNADLSNSNNGWVIRHRHRYLHYRARVVTGTNALFKLVLRPYTATGLGTATTLLNDTTSRTDPYTYSGYIDLNSLSLTVGTEYHIHVENDISGLGTFAVDYFKQADATSL